MYQELLLKTHFYKVRKFPFLKRHSFKAKNIANFVTPLDLKLHNRYYHTEQTSLTSFHVCAFLIFFTYYIYAGSVVLVKETQFQKKNIFTHYQNIHSFFIFYLSCIYQIDPLGAQVAHTNQTNQVDREHFAFFITKLQINSRLFATLKKKY